jgi:hypothetical protein
VEFGESMEKETDFAWKHAGFGNGYRGVRIKVEPLRQASRRIRRAGQRGILPSQQNKGSNRPRVGRFGAEA